MSSIPQTYYVYILVRSTTGKAFYVGKGHGSRVYDHEREARSDCRCHKCNTIRKVWRQGGQVQRYIVFTTNDEAAALAYEIETIALYGRQNLVNQTDGGDGVVNLSPEARAKLRASQQARWTRPEEVEKLRVAKTGHRASPEARANMSKARKGRVLTPEHRAKLSAAAKERFMRPEERARQGVISRGHVISPEGRQRLSDARKGKTLDPRSSEHSAKLSAALKGRPKSAEHRASLSTAKKAFDSRQRNEKDEGKL